MLMKLLERLMKKIYARLKRNSSKKRLKISGSKRLRLLVRNKPKKLKE